MRHNEARALERDHVGDAIKDIGLHPPGLRLGQDLGRGRRLVGAGILQLDARIGLLERFLQRSDRLVHDQGRVPDHLAFFFRGFDQGSVGGVCRCVSADAGECEKNSWPRSRTALPDRNRQPP